MIANISSSSPTKYFLPSISISSGPYFLNNTRLPTYTDMGIRSPFSLTFPGPTAKILPFIGFSFSAVSGITIPDLVILSSVMGSIKTLLDNGLRFILLLLTMGPDLSGQFLIVGGADTSYSKPTQIPCVARIGLL